MSVGGAMLHDFMISIIVQIAHKETTIIVGQYIVLEIDFILVLRMKYGLMNIDYFL